MASTTPPYRPVSHRTFPSAETPPMSGLPPPGIHHFRSTLRVRKLITEIEPSPRFVAYRSLPLRLGYRPCTPVPVRRKPTVFRRAPLISQSPPAFRSAT